MEITLLTMEKVKNSEVLQKYKKKVEPTDFSFIQEGNLYYGCGIYWTKTPNSYSSHSVWYVYSDNLVYYYGDDYEFASHQYGVRPVIPLSEIHKSTQNINRKIINGVEVIEYGEYPQSVVDEKLEKRLENLYQQNKLKKTEKIYTNMQTEHKKEYQEYEYQENKYIRMNEDLIYKRDTTDEKTYWIKIEPIKWLVDKKEKIAISEKILSVMPFSYNDDNNYEKSDIKNFLENYFIKEIKPSKVNKNINEEKINDLIEIMNMLYPEKKQKEKVMIKK